MTLEQFERRYASGHASLLARARVAAIEAGLCGMPSPPMPVHRYVCVLPEHHPGECWAGTDDGRTTYASWPSRVA